MRYELVVFIDCEGRESPPRYMPNYPILYLAGTPSMISMLRQIKEETAEGFIECHEPRRVTFNRTNECVIVGGERLATVYREESR